MGLFKKQQQGSDDAVAPDDPAGDDKVGVDMHLEQQATLALSSGVIVVTDYPDCSALKGRPGPLPTKSGESASVDGEFAPMGVLFDTHLPGRDAPIFAVSNDGEMYGWLVWLEDSPPDDDFLHSPGPLEFVEAGIFCVDSGTFRIVDQAELLELSEDTDLGSPEIQAMPRFDGGGYDGLYAAYTVFRGERLAAIYVAVARGVFPPVESYRLHPFSGDFQTCAAFDTVELANLAADGADLAGKEFRRCVVTDSQLTGARLAGVRIDESAFVRTTLDSADFENASIQYSRFTTVSFRNAALAASFEECRFEDCDFSELTAPPRFVEFNAVIDSRFGAITIDDFAFSGLLVNCSFAGARLPRASLNQVVLTNTDLSQAHLEKAKLNGANLEGADLQGACMREVGLLGAKCSGANFAGADMTLVRAVGADFAGCDFSGANLTNAILRDANFTGANFDGAEFKRAKLRGAKMPDGSTHD